MSREVDTYFADARYYAERFDFLHEDLRRSREALARSREDAAFRTALWFIPNFLYAYYGGIYTIFRFADFLTRRYGFRHTFAIQGVTKITNQADMIREAFPLLAGSPCIPITNEQKDFSRIPDHDIGFCTCWQTAYPLLFFNRVKRKFYFMQDFEPYFYPAGTIYALAEATYRFGFTAICNTVALKETYEAYGGEAVHFAPAVDRHVFYPPPERPEERATYRVVFYGRPFGIRNGFEVAVEALKKVKAELGDKVEIVSAGGGWNVREYGLEGIVRNLNRLPYEKTGDLYRSCDAGLTLMMTRHTSYIPLELMACGCLVVTNKSHWKTWLLRDGDNCQMAEPSASCLAEALIEGLVNRPRRERLVRQALLDMQRMPDWDESFDQAARAAMGAGLAAASRGDSS